MKKQIKKYIKTMYFMAYQINHKVTRKVLFESIGGKYCDNPRAISEKLHELDPSIQICWCIACNNSNLSEIPGYVRIIDVNNRKLFFHELSISSAFVTSMVMPFYKKRKNQYFIQTWHGDRAFKKVLYDSEFLPDEFTLAEANPGYCDLAIAGSDYGEKQYRSAFHYDGEILKVGTPRDDRLINLTKEDIYSLKEKLQVPEDCELLLYAPTLRRENQNNKTKQRIQKIDLRCTLDILSEVTGKMWKCLLRAHPAIVDLTGAGDDSDYINVSKYEDMADLLAISDFLITDYSSCAGDYVLTGRPVVLFQDDREVYMEKDRGFYFDISASPYLIASNQQELEDIIRGLSSDKVKKNCKDILDFYGTHEYGNSSEVIAQKIIKHIHNTL